MTKNYHNFIFCAVALCIIVLSSSVILCRNVKKTAFNGDESNHITSAYYYTNLLLKSDFDLNKWRGEHLSTFGSFLYLHLGQVLMGVPLKWYSRLTGQEFSNLYDFSKTLEENEKAGRIPPQDMLLFARGTNVPWGVLCCVLVFYIGYYSRNLWVGLAAATLLMTNKLFITYATRAMTDVHYNFFLLCTCLLIILFAKSPKEKSLSSLSLVCGILAGLAASVKLMGIAVIGLFLLMYLIYQDVVKNKGLKHILACMLIFSFSAIAVIYILNPYLWDLKNPDKFPILLKTWVQVNNDHARLFLYLWRNNRLWVLHRYLLLRYATFSFEWIFLCGGIIFLSINFIRSLRKKEFRLMIIPFLFFAANYLFILTFMTVNWDRYYLPTIIASKFIASTAMYALGIFLYRYILYIKEKEHL